MFQAAVFILAVYPPQWDHALIGKTFQQAACAARSQVWHPKVIFNAHAKEKIAGRIMQS